MDPITGRFITHDPLGIWGDPRNMGNPYTYVGNNPWSFIDPFGLQSGCSARDPYDPNPILDAGNVNAGSLVPGIADDSELAQYMQHYFLDDLQDYLDSMGLTPWVGNFADIPNGIISAGRRNYGDAVIRWGAGLPLVGLGIGGANKATRAASKALRGYDTFPWMHLGRTYGRGKKQVFETAWEHIHRRHWYDSTELIQGGLPTSRFLKSFTPDDLDNWVQEAIKNAPKKSGEIIYDCKQNIGADVYGNATSILEIIFGA